MARQQADDELRETGRATQQLIDAIRKKPVASVRTVNLDELSEDEALRCSRLFRRLLESGIMRVY
jgi:hypothetical protein